MRIGDLEYSLYCSFLYEWSRCICLVLSLIIQFLVAADVFNADDELVKKYNIPENHDGVELRLFVAGSDSPIVRSEDDEDLVILCCLFDVQVEWIQSNSGLTPIKDTVTVIENSNYNSYIRKSKGKNVFLYAYVPYDANSQNSLVPFMKASHAFKVRFMIDNKCLVC